MPPARHAHSHGALRARQPPSGRRAGVELNARRTVHGQRVACGVVDEEERARGVDQQVAQRHEHAVACIVAPRQLRAAAQHAHKAGRAAAVAHVCAHAARVAAAIRGSHEEGVRGAHKARMRARKRALPRRRAHAAAQPWPHARRKLKRAPLDVLRAVAERLLYGDAHGGTVDGLHNTVEPVAAAVVELQPNDAEVLPDGEALGPCCGVH
mmetsp:Transcript_21223/g.63575  ORF Transcript_21223/g.63575 Transcript_21223/m.63575 type:complete len:210 (-) Transcript_21223:332-961(-)